MPIDLNQYSISDLLLKRRSLRRELSKASNLTDLRIAILGGSTTNEVADFLELLLLNEGFRPVFFQTEYGRYYTDAVMSPEEIVSFRPDIVYVHTCVRNVEGFPALESSEAEFSQALEAELARFRQIWTSLDEKVGCQIIQNNFELPLWAALGNLDAVHTGGHTRFINELNVAFAHEAARHPRLLLQDLHSISARIGLDSWFDHDRWFSYKIAHTVAGNLAIARSLTGLVRALYGRSRKCMVLDLDNTLWGGVIGDDGPDRIQIGRETPVAEAYTAFQEYCLAQRERGVLLAVCSKNDDEVARQGFAHPDTILKLEHFSAFRANWDPKHENIAAIAQELNLGADSFVFVDDNPAERAIVSAQMPGVAVPEVGAEVSRFISILEAARYFEPVSLGKEDLERAKLYRQNSERASLEQKFANYGEYLDSLVMSAEIDSFRPVYLDRIAQLTNKTNQFNVTTRRYTLAETEAIMGDDRAIGLYGRLTDRFGDNGLVAIVLGRRQEDTLHMDLWLMSCRVLKRDMEFAMLDVLVERAQRVGIHNIVGYYLPTKKNGMVARLYETLGFELIAEDPESGNTTWSLNITHYQPRTSHIAIQGAPLHA